MLKLILVLTTFAPLSSLAQEMAEVRLEEDVLVIDGALVSGLFDKIKALDTPKVKRVRINSGGGDTVEGMNIGEFVRDRRLDVEVDGLCLSSCANYIFPAGEKKFVGMMRGSICYHGNEQTSFPTSQAFEARLREVFKAAKVSDEDIEKYVPANLKRHEERVEREKKFFASLGMSPVDLFNMGNYPKSDWVCPTERGFARFGVRNIEGITDRGLHMPDKTIFVDDGINGIQNEICLGDLRRLAGKKCRNQSSFECLANNKDRISASCARALGFEATTDIGIQTAR